MTHRTLFEPEVSSQHWRGTPPPHWPLKRLKWSISGLYNGIWGDEPDGEDDIICIRVADFDRVRKSIASEPPTIRSVTPGYREQRVLRKGDLLIEKSGGGDNQLVGCVVHFDHDFEAVCSNFVARVPLQDGMLPQYWNYVHSSLYSARLNFQAIKQTTGIQNLDAEAYFNIEVAFPPFREQCAIANYLDRETVRIDGLIAEKERMLALLEEKRAALISRIVTRGLDPTNSPGANLNAEGGPQGEGMDSPSSAPLKPSGQEWLGEIPAHWEVTRFKYVCELNPPVDFSSIDEDTEVTFLPMDRIKNGYYIENIEPFSKYSSSYNPFSEGDIVIAKVTPCFENGNISIASGLRNNIGFGSSEGGFKVPVQQNQCMVPSVASASRRCSL